MSETKSAEELAAMQIETGDTTNIPVTIPGMTMAQTLEAKASAEQQKRFEAAREAATAEHDAGVAQPLPLHRLYKSSMPTTYIFKDGTVANFQKKRFLTNNPAEIKELDHEIINKKNPYFQIDPNEREADPTLETPGAKLRAELFAEWTKQLERALNPAQNAGSTEVQKLTPQSSAGVAAVAAGGQIASPAVGTGLSVQMQAVLAKIKGGVK